MSKKTLITCLIIVIFAVSISGAFFLSHMKIFDAQYLSQCVYQYEKGNYDTAIYLCKKESEQENGVGEYFLGMMYSKGLGVSQDLEESRKYFLASSKKGNSSAQLSLAGLYASESNWKEALFWYKNSANDYPIALLKIAEISKILYKKTDEEKYKIDYVSYLRQAVDESVEYAKVLLASDYISGFGVPIDREKAFELLRDFLDSYDKRKRFFAKDISSERILGKKTSFISFARMKYGLLLYRYKNNYSESLKFLLKGYKTAETEYIIARIYYLGLGTKQDLKLSLQWYQSAAASDKPKSEWKAKAIYRLSEFYRSGIIVKENIPMFLELLRKASTQGSLQATEELATFYESGQYVKKDPAKAESFYYRASRMGSNTAKEKIKEYERRKKTTSDTACSVLYFKWVSNPSRKDFNYTNLLRLCRRGTRLGNSQDLYALGGIYYYGLGVKTNVSLAIKYWTESAQKGNLSGLFTIIRIYLYGICPKCKFRNKDNFIIQPDIAQAEKYIKQYVANQYAKRKNKVFFLNYLGYYYYYTDSNRDLYKSYQYYRQAADMKSPSAMYNLAMNYFTGYSFLKKDVNKAISLFEEAALSGNKPAYYRLCDIFYNMGVQPDYKKALYYCSRASSYGYSGSMYLLARMYYYGLGVTRDEKTAYFWFKKSADLGSKKSKAELDKLKKTYQSSK